MRWSVCLSYALLAVVLLCATLPLVWLVLASLDPAASQATKLPARITLDNFRQAFSSRSLRWMANSLLIAGATAALTIVICALAAYPFSRERFAGKNSILYGLLALRVIPASTFMLPVYIFFAKLRLVNTHLSAVVTLTSLNLPFALLLMKGFYDTIPRDFEEAAWVDGCSRLKAIFRILLPQCGPGLAVVAFMTFMNAWNEFMIPLILLRRMDLMPLSVGIYTAFGEHGAVDYGFLSALSLMYALPPILMYLFIRRNLVKGMAGYVK